MQGKATIKQRVRIASIVPKTKGGGYAVSPQNASDDKSAESNDKNRLTGGYAPKAARLTK